MRYVDNISEDVEDKLKEIVERIPRNNYEEALTLRMHELALSKVKCPRIIDFGFYSWKV